MPVRAIAQLAVIAALLAAAGCAGTRPPTGIRPELPTAFPTHSLAQIEARLRSAPDTLTAFEARARLSVRSPAQSGNLSVTLRHRRNDSLYASLSPGLGIEAARLLVTPDSFFVYDRIRRQLSYGSLAYVENLLPTPLEGEDVFRSLLGLLQLPPGKAWRLHADSAYYYLQDGEGHTYTVDPAIWRIVRYETRRTDGAVTEIRVYSEFDVVEGTFLPRRVLLERPLDDTTVSIYYRKITLNPPSLSFALHVSRSAERVLVDGLHGASTE